MAEATQYWEEIQRYTGRSFDNLDDFQALVPEWRFVEMIGGKDAIEALCTLAKEEDEWNDLVQIMVDRINELLPVHSEHDMSAAKNFVKWLDKECKRYYEVYRPHCFIEPVQLTYGRWDLMDLQEALKGHTNTDSKIEFLEIVLFHAEVISGVSIDLQSILSYPRCVGKVLSIGGNFDFDLGDDDRAILWDVLLYLRDHRSELIREEILTPAINGKEITPDHNGHDSVAADRKAPRAKPRIAPGATQTDVARIVSAMKGANITTATWDDLGAFFGAGKGFRQLARELDSASPNLIRFVELMLDQLNPNDRTRLLNRR